ncbi:MAG: hypothetical protein PHW27_03730 [Melioribacteraceae bacterium]|nr:hypothetical protein [Melioribacteraceae bacterium]MDD3557662.1 hypothetical protein [Melioribacteraceae bacterium]
MELIEVIKYILFGLVGLFAVVLIISFIASRFKKEPPPEAVTPVKPYKYERPKSIPKRGRQERRDPEKMRSASGSRIKRSAEKKEQIVKREQHVESFSTKITSRYEVITDLKKAKSIKEDFRASGFN